MPPASSVSEVQSRPPQYGYDQALLARVTKSDLRVAAVADGDAKLVHETDAGATGGAPLALAELVEEDVWPPQAAARAARA